MQLFGDLGKSRKPFGLLLVLEPNAALMTVVYAIVMRCVTLASCEQVLQLQTYQGSCFFFFPFRTRTSTPV
jgi:formate hydrogenlyase subunit 3/multisubunit Na+/H+ antiporter MnhD subunit